MSLLEIVTKAFSSIKEIPDVPSKYPIILNSDEILPKLKPEHDDSGDFLMKQAMGWRISEKDSEIIQSESKFFKILKRKLKNPKSFDQVEFLGLLNRFLEKNAENAGLSVNSNPSDPKCTIALVEKLGFLIGSDTMVLIFKACVFFDLWDLLDTFVVRGHASNSCLDCIIESLILKKRTLLICSCIRHISNIQASCIFLMLRYFLSPFKDSCTSFIGVRKKWESQALMALVKATKSLHEKKSELTKQAAILLAMAHDDFSSSELCLHFLFSSSQIDEMTLSSSIARLSSSETLSLIRYFGKWMKKYKKYPQLVPCSSASSIGLEFCKWVPSLESVANHLGIILDVGFSRLILHAECCEELKSIQEIVKEFASVTEWCSLVANFIENLRSEVAS